MGYLTVNEAAALLRVSDLTVRRWIWSGKLPATRVGRLLRIRQSDIEGLTQPTQTEANGTSTAPRPGTAGALLAAVQRGSRYLKPGDVEELEQLIEEGCELPGEVKEIFG
jgi:excisionase family DNA binding protein